MDQLKPYLNLYKVHKKLFKTAVIVIVMIAAVVVFGLKGEKEKTLTQFVGENGETIELSSAAGDAENADGSGNSGISISIYVDISGEVKNPGVYEVKDGSRLFEVIEKAGGLKKDADTTDINQAEIVTDGQKIIVPSKNDEDVGGVYLENPTIPKGDKTYTPDGAININTADSAGLQEIPGVGPATAEKIIAYRQANGKFKTIEDLKNVSGIGNKTFEKIKDMIGV